jgi:O-antigen ligase
VTIGILVLLLIWFALIYGAIQRPWIGIIGYCAFAILCPTWNWRWGLPLWDYQKFLAGATLIGWFFASFYRQKLSSTSQWALWAGSGYIFAVLVSSFFTISPIKTAVYWDVTWKIALMTGIALFVLDLPSRLLTMIWAATIAQGWNALNVNQLYFERGFINVINFNWNHLDNNTYSISTLPVMAMAFALLMCSEKLWQQGVAGIILLLQMHQIMLLQSRGTMLGSLFMVLLGVLFMPKNRITIPITIAAFLAGAVLAGPPVIEEFMSSFKSDGERDSSAESRFYLWKAGSAILMEYPLLGVGPWAGEVMVPRYYEGDLGGLQVKALHNLFFEVGTGCGIPGLLCYLAFFFVPWFAHFRIWRQERNELPHWMRAVNLSVLCGIPGYWAASMFSSGALIESPYVLVMLGCTSLSIFQAEDRDEEETSEHDELEDDDESFAKEYASPGLSV